MHNYATHNLWEPEFLSLQQVFLRKYHELILLSVGQLSGKEEYPCFHGVCFKRKKTDAKHQIISQRDKGYDKHKLQ